MQPHTRAIIAAAAYAVAQGKKVAGVYDHAAGRHLRIAAEARGGRLQGLDGDRAAKFGGVLPEVFDQRDKAFVTLEVDGVAAAGYDRASASHYVANTSERQVQLFDHGVGKWFSYDMQVAEG